MIEHQVVIDSAECIKSYLFDENEIISCVVFVYNDQISVNHLTMQMRNGTSLDIVDGRDEIVKLYDRIKHILLKGK